MQHTVLLKPFDNKDVTLFTSFAVLRIISGEIYHDGVTFAKITISKECMGIVSLREHAVDTVSCFLRACGGNVVTSTQADGINVTNCAVSCVLSVLMNEN